MAGKTNALKTLEKALEQLKAQDSNPKRSAEAAPTESKKAELVLKEARKFGEGLVAGYEAEKAKVQSFLEALNAIEAGTYVSKRGGSKKGGRRKKTEVGE